MILLGVTVSVIKTGIIYTLQFSNYERHDYYLYMRVGAMRSTRETSVKLSHYKDTQPDMVTKTDHPSQHLLRPSISLKSTLYVWLSDKVILAPNVE